MTHLVDAWSLQGRVELVLWVGCCLGRGKVRDVAELVGRANLPIFGKGWASGCEELWRQRTHLRDNSWTTRTGQSGIGPAMCTRMHAYGSRGEAMTACLVEKEHKLRL